MFCCQHVGELVLSGYVLCLTGIWIILSLRGINVTASIIVQSHQAEINCSKHLPNIPQTEP